MFFLLLSIISSAMIALIMRLSSHKVRNPISMLLTNYLVCMVLGAVYADFRIILPQHPGYSTALGLGIFNGFVYLGSFVLYQHSVRKNGIVLSAIFMKLGLLVPMLLSVLLFREMPSTLQVAGFVLAVAAIVLINYRKNTEKHSLGFDLILLLFLGGCADAMSKVYQMLGPETLSDQFLVFTYGTAFIMCLALVLLKKERPGSQDFLYGAIIGLPNFFNTKFMLLALPSVPAVVAYPTFSVFTMLLVTLTGILFFREKLSKHQWIALGIILISLVLLNI